MSDDESSTMRDSKPLNTYSQMNNLINSDSTTTQELGEIALDLLKSYNNLELSTDDRTLVLNNLKSIIIKNPDFALKFSKYLVKVSSIYGSINDIHVLINWATNLLITSAKLNQPSDELLKNYITAIVLNLENLSSVISLNTHAYKRYQRLINSIFKSLNFFANSIKSLDLQSKIINDLLLKSSTSNVSGNLTLLSQLSLSIEITNDIKASFLKYYIDACFTNPKTVLHNFALSQFNDKFVVKYLIEDSTSLTTIMSNMEKMVLKNSELVFDKLAVELFKSLSKVNYNSIDLVVTSAKFLTQLITGVKATKPLVKAGSISTLVYIFQSQSSSTSEASYKKLTSEIFKLLGTSTIVQEEKLEILNCFSYVNVDQVALAKDITTGLLPLIKRDSNEVYLSNLINIYLKFINSESDPLFDLAKTELATKNKKANLRKCWFNSIISQLPNTKANNEPVFNKFCEILDTESLQVLTECTSAPLPSVTSKLITAAYSSISYLLSISTNKDDSKLSELLKIALSDLNILTNSKVYVKLSTYDEVSWFSQAIYYVLNKSAILIDSITTQRDIGYSLLFLNSSSLITSYKNTQLNKQQFTKLTENPESQSVIAKCLSLAFNDYILKTNSIDIEHLELNPKNFRNILFSLVHSFASPDLLIDLLVITHHDSLLNDTQLKKQNLWISLCIHANVDPNELVKTNAKVIMDKLTTVLGSADAQCHESGYYHATVKAIATVAYVNHEAIVPLLTDLFDKDLDPSHLISGIDDFKLQIWKGKDGELVEEEVGSKSNREALDKGSKDYETLQWEKSVRKDLANKKPAAGKKTNVKLSKEEIIKLNEKIEQQSVIRAQINNSYNSLRRSLEIVSQLSQNAKVFDNGSDVWFPLAVGYIFEIFSSNDCMLLVKQLAIDTFIKLSDVLEFSFSQIIAINTLRLFNVIDNDDKDYKLNDSQSLNSILSFLLFKLKMASDKNTFSSTVLIYLLPLLIKVAELGKSYVLKTKGKKSAIVIKTEFIEEDPEEELLTLVLEILSSNAETFQDSKIQRTAILDNLLSLMTIPSKAKLAKDCFMSLIQNISINLSQTDLLLIISKLVNPVKFVRTAILEGLDSEFDLANDYKILHSDIPPELYISVFDNEELNAQLALTVWEESQFDLNNDKEMPFKLIGFLGSKDTGIRLSAAKALASCVETLSKSDSSLFSTTLHKLLDLYSLKRQPPPPIKDSFGLIIKSSMDQPDTWEERSGVALSLELMAKLFVSETEVELFFRFLVLDEKAFGDVESSVVQELSNAALNIINIQGAKFVEILIPIFEEGLAVKDSGTKEQDQIKENTIIIYGALARHLDPTDIRLEKIIKRLLKTLDAPSEDVQFAVSGCLAPLVPKIDSKMLSKYYDDLFEKLFTGAKLAHRRGAAYGLSGLVKGGGIKALVEHDVIRNLTDASDDKKDPKKREGVSFAFECLSQSLGALFEPYVIEILPIVLKNLGDQVPEVRDATDYSSRTIMKHTTSYGIKKLIPLAIENLDDISWRSKKGSVDLLGSMAYLDPTQLSANLPIIVPEIVKVLNDSHKEVRKAADQSLKRFGEVIRNPEIQQLVPILLKAIGDPTKYTNEALDELINTQFVHYIDGPSLALIIHVIHRGMYDRSALVKRKACQIVGNMSILVDSKDLIPYLPQLIMELETAMVDPVTATRATAARALGSLVEKLGEERFPDLIPRLLSTLQDPTKAGDRLGSAQALAEVISGLGLGKLDELLPTILAGTRSKQAHVRAGFMPMLLFLPVCFGAQFAPYLASTIPPILNGLADVDEEIRETALRSGRLIVSNYAKKAVDLLLPELENGLSDSNPRIRLSSVELTGELLFKISGISGKQELSDDLTSISNSVNKAFDEVLGEERRDRILASLFMCRADTTGTVRVATINIWKALVANTPKTVKEILPTLTQIIIRRLASADETQRTIAAQTLGEMVRRVGSNALSQLLPTLEESLISSDSDAKQGICIAARELIDSTSTDSVVEYQEIFVNIIRDALVDANPAVREAAAQAFDVLQDKIGNGAVDEVIPQLLEMLGDNDNNDSSENALSALEEIMATKADVIFPILIPSLLAPPINARALGALAQVAGSALFRRLSTIINALIDSVIADDKENNRADLIDALCRVLLSVESDEGCHPLMQQILNTMRHEDAKRAAVIYEVLPKFFESTILDYSVYTQDVVTQCILSLEDPEKIVAKNAFDSLTALIKRQPKDSLEKLVRPAQQTLTMIGKPGQDLYVFTLPKGPNCILPIFLHGLMYGSTDQREMSANGITDIIDRTPADGLKPFITVIVGPLIRVIGERSSSDVKSAVLLALNKLFGKIPQFLRPFIPQLQRTFVKSLSDAKNEVLRTRAAKALGTLIEYQPRVDPLVAELLTGAKQATGEENLGVKTAMLKALLEVVSKAGSKMSEASKSGVMSLVEQEMFSVEVGVDTAVAYARLIGALSLILTKDEAIKMIKNKVLSADMEDSNSSRFAILTLNAFLKDSPEHIFTTGLIDEICAFIATAGTSKMPYVSDNATVASGKLLLCMNKFDGAAEESKDSVAEVVQSLAVLMSAPASNSLDTRRLALVVVRTICRFVYDEVVKSQIDVLGPAVFSCVRDPIIPIKLAAEKAFLAVFNLVEDEKAEFFQQWISGKQELGTTIETVTGTTLQIRSVSEYVKRIATRLAGVERERIESGGDAEAMFSDRFEDENEIWAIGGVELSKE